LGIVVGEEMNILGVTELIVVVIIAIIILLPLWRICAKAGFSPWLGVLFFIPLVNLVLLYYLAFTKWPVQARNQKP
jgi:hypothetical protein